jgi:small-conductance mechanosensitive channel
MSRKRNRRDTSDIASDLSPRALPVNRYTVNFNTQLRDLEKRQLQAARDIARENLLALEDRRRYKPDRTVRPPTAIKRKYTRIVPHRLHVRFNVPSKIALCLRRKVRKEIMHAFKKAGKGGMKKPKFNFWSKVGC